MKPNGLFSQMKKNALKPNGLFSQMKRLKPNGLFSQMKRNVLKPNGLFSSIKRDRPDTRPLAPGKWIPWRSWGKRSGSLNAQNEELDYNDYYDINDYANSNQDEIEEENNESVMDEFEANEDDKSLSKDLQNTST